MAQPTAATSTSTSTQGDTPSESWIVVPGTVCERISVLKSLSAPYFMTAENRAYIPRAIQEPTRPSPAR